MLTAAATLCALLSGFALRFRQQLHAILTSRFIQASACLVFTAAMTSGVMWTRIRKPPPFGIKGDGKFEYFAQSLQQQYGMESSIVTALGTSARSDH